MPADKLDTVLREAKSRLREALGSRITARTNYNRILPPNLATSAPEQTWSQPFSLMLRAARLLREFLTDPWFPKKLSGLRFTTDQFEQAMNIFGDVITKSKSRDRAEKELKQLDDIEKSKDSLRNKCAAVMAIITGQSEIPRGHEEPGATGTSSSPALS